MRNKNMNLFIGLGDMHYSGTNTIDSDTFEYAYYEMFSKNKAQARFYKN